jgi:biotin-(acetyl-CoA carboxylase) ligase
MDFERYVAEIERGRTRAGVAPELGRDNLVVLARTVSTNLLARVVVGEFESEGLDLGPMLVLALEQSGGRGRHGRSWSSPRGRGVYATLAQPFPKPELLPALPLLAGVGLCRALAAHLPHGCRLKWPNDLLVPALGEPASGAGQGAGAPATAGGLGDPAGPGDPGRHLGRKIGGILIEAMVHPGDGCVALIGFGVNHGQRQEELPDGATSLLLESGGHLGGGMGVGLAELTWDLVGGLERELAHAGDLPYAVAAYRELVAHRPGDRLLCRVGERRVAGTFAGIDDAGRLRLRFPQTVGDGSPAAEAGGPAAGDSDPAAGEPDGELLLSAGEVIAG